MGGAGWLTRCSGFRNIPRGDSGLPKPGKLFLQGVKESCTNRGASLLLRWSAEANDPCGKRQTGFSCAMSSGDVTFDAPTGAMSGSEADSLVFSSSRPTAGGVFAMAKGVTEPACRVKADGLLYGKKHDSGG